MEILQKYPPITKTSVNCTHCNSLLQVTDKDILSVNYGIIKTRSNTKYRLFRPAITTETIIKGYEYGLKCPVCNREFTVADHETIDKNDYRWYD